MSAAVRIKGQAFVGFQTSLSKRCGPLAVPTILKALPDEISHALERGEIVSVGWYPIDWYAKLHEVARAAHGPAISRDIARDAARSDVTTIYRFILRFLSPQTLMGQSARVFRLFCDGGACTVEKTEAHRATLLYTGCPGANRGFWDNVLGGSETIVELCGGRDVEAQVLEGGGDGDAKMRCEIKWRNGEALR
jgi:hypothetical protein